MAAYYNEHDGYAAEWLRNLIHEGLIADGDVDERDIWDVHPRDLAGYTQCHFFAGIGGWSAALRLAGWPDARPVWTGSCPCQPFSQAGAVGGFADERHLWPAFHYLIAQCRPPVVFGEQVDSPAAKVWLDLVHADLEGSGYAVGVAVLPAASVGAPHGRHRTWFVADAAGDRATRHPREEGGARVACGAEPGGSRAVRELAHSPTIGRREERPLAGGIAAGDRAEGLAAGFVSGGAAGAVANSANERHDRRRASETGDGGDAARIESERLRVAGLVGHADDEGPQGRLGMPERPRQRATGAPGVVSGFWADADWLFCRDSKWRPVEPGTFPLAHGVRNRVGRLRAYGNAIVPQVAARFIEAYLDVRPRHYRLG